MQGACNEHHCFEGRIMNRIAKALIVATIGVAVVSFARKPFDSGQTGLIDWSRVDFRLPGDNAVGDEPEGCVIAHCNAETLEFASRTPTYGLWSLRAE